MSPTGHDQDRLIDYAYGELSPSEAKSLEAHLESCSQCSRALDDIRKVRRTMAQLPTVPAPAQGLDSLLAYAQQAARRAQAGSASHSRLWRWVLLPGTGALAMVLLIVVTTRVAQQTSLMSVRSAPASTVRSAPARTVPPPSPSTRDQPSALDTVADATKVESYAKKEPAAKDEGKSRAMMSVSKPKSELRAAAAPKEPEGAGAGSEGNAASELKAAPKALRAGLSTAEQQAVPGQAVAKSAARRDESSGTVGGPLQVEESRVAKPGARPDESSGTVGGLLQVEGSRVAKSAAPRDEASGKAGGPPQVEGSRVGKSAAREDEPSAVVTGVRQRAMSGPQASAPAAPQTQSALEREIARVKDTLRTTSVTGLERAWLMNHLCELLYAANRPAEAGSTCDRVIRDYPGSAAAAAARQLKVKNPQAQKR